MSNNLNITTSNFGENQDYMYLYDPILYLDFRDGVGPKALGFMEKEKVFKATTQYAIAKAGIPAYEIRRDMIDQEFSLEGQVKQVQPEVLALLMQRRYDDGDSEWNRVIIGSEIPSPVFPSAILVGQNVNGSEMRIYIRRMQINSENLEVSLGGEDYSQLQFAGRALKDTDPIVNNPTWPHIGKVSFTGSLTESDETVASISGADAATGLYVGAPIIGTGIPDGATISDLTDIATGSLEMSAAATAAGSGVSIVSQKSSDYSNHDNIAFFAWAKSA